MPLVYLDSSALVKLVVPEPESKALIEHLEERPQRVSSTLALTELPRALDRAGLGAIPRSAVPGRYSDESPWSTSTDGS